jgi:hypothetical protein
VKVDGKPVGSFELSGDICVVTDYSNDMKYIMKGLLDFLKETKDLVQIGRNEIIDIHDFFQ